MIIYEANKYGPRIKKLLIERKTDKSFWIKNKDYWGGSVEMIIRHALGPEHHFTFEDAQNYLLVLYNQQIERFKQNIEYVEKQIEETKALTEADHDLPKV